jgi:hypothetical protein
MTKPIASPLMTSKRICGLERPTPYLTLERPS